MKELLKVCLNTPMINEKMGVPVLIWGSPGGGKTSIVEDLACEMGLPLEVVILSVREPSEVAGLPIKTNDGVVIEPPMWAKNISKAGRGIVFFDELNTAPPSVQSAALRIIMDRVVGDLKLPNEVRIIAATNPVDESAGGWDLSPPIANRFVHINYQGPTVDEWTTWLIGGDKKESSSDVCFEDKWVNEHSKAKGVVSAFLLSRPNLLGPNVPNDPEKSTKGWVSPRSWDMAVRLIASSSIYGLDNYDLIEGCVGVGAANEFKAFQFYADLPSPRDLVEGRTEFRSSELDRRLAVLMSLASYAISFPDVSSRVWELVSEISKDARDTAVPTIRKLVNAGLCNSEEAMKTMSEFDEYVSDIIKTKIL